MGKPKLRLYQVFEPMTQYAVFEVMATSQTEAIAKVIHGDEAEIMFSFTDEPMPDSRRRVTAKRAPEPDVSEATTPEEGNHG